MPISLATTEDLQIALASAVGMIATLRHDMQEGLAAAAASSTAALEAATNQLREEFLIALQGLPPIAKGVATLERGAAEVPCDVIDDNSWIVRFGMNADVSGVLLILERSEGRSFTLKSSNPGDNGNVFWMVWPGEQDFGLLMGGL